METLPRFVVLWHAHRSGRTRDGFSHRHRPLPLRRLVEGRRRLRTQPRGRSTRRLAAVRWVPAAPHSCERRIDGRPERAVPAEPKLDRSRAPWPPARSTSSAVGLAPSPRAIPPLALRRNAKAVRRRSRVSIRPEPGPTCAGQPPWGFPPVGHWVQSHDASAATSTPTLPHRAETLCEPGTSGCEP